MQDALLRQLSNHLHHRLIDAVHPLYLIADSELRLIESQGEAAHYGLAGLAPGQSLLDPLPFLAETLTPSTDSLSLPMIELPGGRIADIDILSRDDRWGIIMVDAEQAHRRRQREQQQTHDLQLLKREQEKLLSQLHRANQAKSRFIANMSHEFRTPLTSIMGYTDLLRDSCSAQSQERHYLGAVERGARHLLVLIDNLLDEGRMDADRFEINLLPVAACDLLRETGEMLQSLATQKQLTLTTACDPLPPLLLLDPMRLRQLLINLTGNALKYTDEGHVTVSAGWQSDRLTVTITDTGPGIASENLERIFEPFQQTGSTGRGAGLGLAISRRIARHMGGDLRAESTPGKGSHFILELPAPQAGDQPAQMQAVTNDRHLLIADDDPDIRDLIRFHLEQAGYRVDSCSEGACALDRARSETPSLVLMDFNMPGKDGLACTHSLRQGGYTNPVIIVTAAPGEIREAASRAGVDRVLPKPIDPGQLLDTIAQLLARQGAQP